MPTPSRPCRVSSVILHARRAVLVLTTSLLLLLGGCGEAPQDTGPLAVEVTAVTVEPKDTPVAFEFVGKTASSRRVEIRSRVEGFLEKRLYTEGVLVQSGQPLFQMDRKPFEAELRAAKAELAQQQARLTNSRANLKRVKPLAEQNAVAQKELDDAESLYRSAAASVEAAKAKVVQAELNLGYTTITSPLTGLASFATQREGAYIGIASGSVLTYVAQVEPMWVEFSVSENQILKSRQQQQEGKLKAPESDELDVEVVLADGTIHPHTGRITFADAALSEETGTFLLRAEVANTDSAMRPGQFVRVFLRGMVRPKAMLVPQRAVQQGAKGSFVWVVNDAGQAEFRPIVVGPWHGDQWFVNDGLTGGETVVVNGALKLRAGVPVKVVEAAAAQAESG
ncbi:MAG: efflux RND transporter periplasmic adaptor subunit [Pseudomonadota bacterium]|nr:MAG: efflux RND transporter periplasmic adaptor subunit [Pseudomonadota bacterium]